MPMLWRVLYTLEQIIANEGIILGLTELSHLYNLVSHGSQRFLFKAKPQQPHPILKTTNNVSNWRNQFFFVRRDSIPNGNHLPEKWNVEVTNINTLKETPATAERIAAFWALDSTVRTFSPKVKDIVEATSSSYTMSSTAKSSSRSASKFGLEELEGIISPRSFKKELAGGQSQSEAKGMTLRAKAGSKRKKPSEPAPPSDAFQLELDIHSCVSEKVTQIQALQEKTLVEAEETIADHRAFCTAKDKKDCTAGEGDQSLGEAGNSGCGSGEQGSVGGC